ncbi:hypothetical protein A2U01_0083739, partial [Trifolium medium]|nr:hypothetical protein [Trifolium medium]
LVGPVVMDAELGRETTVRSQQLQSGDGWNHSMLELTLELD